MTISATPRKAGPFTGNGTQTVFPFSFKVFAASDVKVTTADTFGVETVLTTGYSVSLNPDQVASPGGAVTLASALALNFKLTLVGNLPLDQTLAIPGGGNYNPVAHENELDRIVMQMQQLAEQLARAVKVAVTDNADPATYVAGLSVAVAAAAASATAAQNYLNSFKGQYYGAATGDPTLDPLGNPITAGDLYFNSATTTMRVWSGAAWVDTGAAQPVTVNVQRFSGTGAQTVFTLSTAPAFQNGCEVYISGVAKVPGVDYTVTGTTLTFISGAPASGTNNIFVRSISAYGGGVPNDGSVTTSKLASLSVATANLIDACVATAKLADGSVTLAKLAAIYGTGANQLVQLDATSKLPAVDGSQLSGLPAGAPSALDAVGSVALLYCTTQLAALSAGATTSGSSLRAYNTGAANPFTALRSVTQTTTVEGTYPGWTTAGTALGGTWRLLAAFKNTQSSTVTMYDESGVFPVRWSNNDTFYPSIWQRIA